MAYDLNRVTKEFREICEKANVAAGLTIPIKLNGRLTRTLGRVQFKYDLFKAAYTCTLVEFSKQLLETATDESIRDVILHEAAHLIVTERTGERHNHDAMFKEVCAEIGASANGATTTVERTVEKAALYKYSVYCPTCKKIVGNYSRMCPTLRNIDDCFCSRCKQGNLEVTQNW